MSFLPSDWASFIWGAVVGLFAAFFTGFFTKAGEHAYAAIHSRVFPKPPEPIEVHRHFSPDLYKLGGCSWVSEVDVPEFEDKGYIHYPHPSGAPKCFRSTYNGHADVKEFLMVQPGAQKNV